VSRILPQIGRSALVLAVLLLGGSLRAVFKYLPAPGLVSAVMLGGGFGGYAALLFAAHHSSLARSFFFRRPKLLCALLLLAIAAASYVIYPIADARRDQGAGSTADDAIIQAAHDFLSSGSMYARTLPGGIPLSPGPGWVLLNVPLANSPWYWALSPLYILVCLLIYGRLVGSAYQSAVVLCLLSTSLLFWELLVTGHDLVALGFALAALSMAAWKLSLDRDQGLLGPAALGIVLGMIATSRLIFAPFPLLLALLAWKSNRKFALRLGGVGVLVTALLHAYFYATSDYYQPLHLWGRGKGAGWDLMVLGMAAEIIALAYVYRRVGRRPTEWLYGVWLVLAVPLFFISLGELRSVGWNFARWEGANYLFPSVPCYLFYMATTMCPPRDDVPKPVAEKS